MASPAADLDYLVELKAMLLEAAVLRVATSETHAFELASRKASLIVAAAAGYISHELQRCLEQEGKYLLLVR